MNFEPLSGIVPAPMTPMNADFSVDWRSLESYIDWIAAARPTAIAMNMAAGEGPSLYPEEQIEVIRICKNVIAGRARLFSGLISRNTEEAVNHGRALRDAGVEGFAVFPPFPTFLGNPVPTEMVYQFHKAIADGVGLPMVLFQFPKAFGPDYPPETIRRVAEIPEVVALKEAAFDSATCQQTIETVRALPRRIGILTGSDTVILESMQMGCNGALIGFAGTATDRLIAMNDAVARGDAATATAIWAKLGPLARFLWRAPLRDYRPRMKELLRMQGKIAHAACRPPQLGIADDEKTEIRRLAVAAELLN